MTQNNEPAVQDAPHVISETVTVKALVTLTVAPQEGQSLEAAEAEMFVRLQQYLTGRENTFLSDYGTTAEELAKFRADETEEQPTWGGYEGPFVLESAVEPVAPETHSYTVIGAWIDDEPVPFGVIEGEHQVSGGDDQPWATSVEAVDAAAAEQLAVDQMRS